MLKYSPRILPTLSRRQLPFSWRASWPPRRSGASVAEQLGTSGTRARIQSPDFDGFAPYKRPEGVQYVHGVAMIGLGESDAPGDERIQEAIDQAINSPLLEVDISQANGVLIDVIGGTDMTISEAERAAEEIQARVGQNARIIWGAAVDPAMDKTVRVMLVATGVKSKQILGKPQEKRFRGVGEVEMVH